MGNTISSPLCVAANNQSVYLAAYDKGMTDGNLVLLRSNPFPTSLESAKWELLAKQPAREIFYNPTLNPNSYMCAATDDGAFMILSDEYHSDEKYGDFTGAILDASTSNEWETVKFAKGLCLQRESCSAQLLATPAGHSDRFTLIVQHAGGEATESNRTLTFLTHKTGINLFVEQPTAFDVQFNKHTLYSWDGRGALNKIRDFKHIGGMDFSYTPVPAREGNESWSVVLADYDNFDMGLFGLGGLPKTAYWQSNKPAKVSATGLPADLSTGGIVGIAIGTVTLVVITGIAVRNWRHRLKNKKCDIELSKIGSRKDPVDRLTRE
ncbi:hypothetical protein BGZ92_008320 [Podila epicladia]|nr:hypothetical protein BGZ92_008320 [Podila epicladia]